MAGVSAQLASGGAAEYVAFGLRILSEIALPELARGGSNETEIPSVSIRLGSLPASLDNARHIGAHFQAGDRDVLCHLPGIARFRVRAGEEIVVDRLADASDELIRLPLIGAALTILCLQRGLLPLHANAMEVGGEAVCLAGNSGAGKSTLAARFERKGFGVLADDICVVSLDGHGGIVAWPGIPRLRLWRKAADAIGDGVSGFERLVDGADKYMLPLSTHVAAKPLPLRRLYVLPDPSVSSGGGMVRLSGLHAVRAVLENTHRGWAAAPMRMAEAHFEAAVAVASAVEVYHVERKWGLDIYDSEADKLERHMRN